MATWNIDNAHSQAEFSVRHMMISTVRGDFAVLNGSLEFDPANPAASSVEATIDVASIDTRVEDRNKHLRSADFFDVENYPVMTFKSSKVEVTGETTGVITGDLTIRDVTKEVSFTVDYFGEMASPFGDERVGFSGSTTINREDWGLTWNQPLANGGVLVSKDVKISVELQAMKVTEAVKA